MLECRKPGAERLNGPSQGSLLGMILLPLDLSFSSREQGALQRWDNGGERVETAMHVGSVSLPVVSTERGPVDLLAHARAVPFASPSGGPQPSHTGPAAHHRRTDDRPRDPPDLQRC